VNVDIAVHKNDVLTKWARGYYARGFQRYKITIVYNVCNLLMNTRYLLYYSIGYVSMSPFRSVDIDTPGNLELARQIAATDGEG